VFDAAARRELSAALAAAFLAGVWTESALVRRGAIALAPRPRWLPALVRDVLAAYQRPPADRPRELAAYVALLLAERPAVPGAPRPRVRRWFSPQRAMGRAPWPVPPIATTGELAERLELDPGHLEWLADARGLERTVGARRLRHYTYLWQPRPSAPPRPIARPKLKLKEIQRWILHEILDRIPAHDAAHGFVRGRSARSHAALHVGHHTVLRMDLEDFFASVPASRVYGVFRTAGYPEAVAHTLTALCVTVVPQAEWDAVPRPEGTDSHLLRRHYRLGRRLATPHLPQGAPTSPALASLAATGLDRRLAALAPALHATYSRYADDLAFSGAADMPAGTIRRVVTQIAKEEGFLVATDKTSVRHRHERQLVCGVVVNERANVPRHMFDRLKATLHDAARHGPTVANRGNLPNFRAHLQGRVAWVAQLHPARGRRLQALLDQIDW
jgi:RNA-directed DNA polymerase